MSWGEPRHDRLPVLLGDVEVGVGELDHVPGGRCQRPRPEVLLLEEKTTGVREYFCKIKYDGLPKAVKFIKHMY